MAIAFQLGEYSDLGRLPGNRPPLVALPAVKIKRYSAAGVTDALTPGALVFQLKNTGDAIFVRLNLTADTTQAANGATLTDRLGTGDVLEFMLPDDAVASGYFLDVRAA